MKTEINKEDLEKFLSSEDVTYASSTRECKRLYINLHGVIHVTAAHKLIYAGVSTETAVKIYNGITKKYVDPTKDFKI